MTRGAAAVSIAAALLLVAGVAAAATPVSKPADDAVISDAGGHRLGEDPTLLPGERFHVQVKGFAPQATVTLSLLGSAATITDRANAAGILNTHDVAPRAVGSYRLAISGPISDGGSRQSGNLVMRVPRVTIIRFRVVTGGHGVGGKGSHHGNGGGSTALTGVDVLGLLAGGLLVLVVGLALLRAGARRRR